MLSNPLKRVALRLLKALDIEEARAQIGLLENNQWDQLAAVKFDPMLHRHRSIRDFRKICLAQEFLRKADFLDTSHDRKQVARDGFLQTEAQCFVANRHLERFMTTPTKHMSDVEAAFFRIVNRARAWIADTLGPVPGRLNGHFGPGAVFESEVWCHKKSMTAYDKLRNMPSVTPHTPKELVYHCIGLTAYSEAWGSVGLDNSFPLSRGNRFTTVPKDATKDRGIAVEPGVNVLLQLAVGDILKLRLRRRGIDLKGTEDRMHPVLKKLGMDVGRPWKGQMLHRRLAKEASLTGSHATIDLSNASDTVCQGLVELLLPEAWYNLLSDLRSPLTRFSPTGRKKDMRWYRLEKFSSMGNGFTFELETLIFCALAHGVGARIGADTYVYGDDIIIPTTLARDMIAVLKYCGLTPNEKKTFVSADVEFRESCGGDYFLGHDVRPFYIKEHPNAPEDWIHLANNIRNISLKWEMPELVAVRAAVLDQIPYNIRSCRGPEQFGDLVIHDDPELWNARVRGSQRYFRVWRPVQRKRYLFSRPYTVKLMVDGRQIKQQFRELTEQGVALAAALIGLPSDGLAPRNFVEGYRFGRVAYS